MESSPLNVLEFYSGIGGMHYALKQSGINYKVIGALDINTLANQVYKHNFPNTKLLQKNIEGLECKDVEKLNADVWTMSPPCQPYTRQGKQEESNDPRAKSFINIMVILKKMKYPPRYIFLENVKGFENSDTRDQLIDILKGKSYKFQEVLITPTDFGVPNSRLRYYLMAKHLNPFSFNTTNIIHKADIEYENLTLEGNTFENRLRSLLSECLSKTIQEATLSVNIVDAKCFYVPNDILSRFYNIMDIVHQESTKSCCFTKSYSKYIEGTGSIYTELTKDELGKISRNINDELPAIEKIELLSELKLRYFTPSEVSSLMCFPNSGFSFPDSITVKQKYRLLGNSINVYIVSMLMQHFLFDDLLEGK